jgi:hypothetical protein
MISKITLHIRQYFEATACRTVSISTGLTCDGLSGGVTAVGVTVVDVGDELPAMLETLSVATTLDVELKIVT